MIKNNSSSDIDSNSNNNRINDNYNSDSNINNNYNSLRQSTLRGSSIGPTLSLLPDDYQFESPQGHWRFT